MNRTRPIAHAALLAACALTAGCGNNNENDNDGTKTVASTKTTPRSLARPAYPRCAVHGFQKQTARPITGPTGTRFWALTYNRAPTPNQPPPPTTTTTTSILIAEHHPATPLPKQDANTHPKTIAGHHVLYRPPNNNSRSIIAIWKTKHAYYSLIANGPNPTPVNRLITCLP